MSVFKTPQEAIAACDAAGEVAWAEFSKVNNIKPEIDPAACNIARQVFRAGYMAGAKFVSGYIVSNIQKHAKNSIIQPNEPAA